MAIQPRTWVSLWVAATIPIIFWDIGYCFMRPRSMLGGDLHWIWKPYEIYQNVDLLYGIPALEEHNGFTNAQTLLNFVENLLNLFYLYLAHGLSTPSPAAPIVVLCTACMTLSKTVLYWAQEYYCGYCAVGHNTLYDLIVYWILPNGLWIVVPSVLIYQVSKDLVAELQWASVARAGKNGKVQ